ncbi:MAG: UDP-N-acetylglucosamine 2-epimerase (non-hydrolyzing), partial [Clostridiales bacterium]|nr:UDP-N-acetylglucosamine 2-epimerase (non-hydrolyzing) [Clostridiales bacterium]
GTIYDMAARLLTDSGAYREMAHAVNPYGDGNASERIADAILYRFGKGARPVDLTV